MADLAKNNLFIAKAREAYFLALYFLRESMIKIVSQSSLKELII
jgi:hypothetical protein